MHSISRFSFGFEGGPAIGALPESRRGPDLRCSTGGVNPVILAALHDTTMDGLQPKSDGLQLQEKNYGIVLVFWEASHAILAMLSLTGWQTPANMFLDVLAFRDAFGKASLVKASLRGGFDFQVC